MLRLSILVALPLLLCGCVPRSEVEAVRADLTEARKQVDLLQSQRVPRPQYDSAQSSLRVAARRIDELERELKTTREQLASLERERLAASATSGTPVDRPAAPATGVLAAGSYEPSNGTYVYSPDALLHFGANLQITSPSGLMVSDPEQKVVAGELQIKTDRGLSMETEDGMLSSQPDGSVKFIGNRLTMKFAPENQPAQPAGENRQTTAPEATASPATGK